MNDMYHVGHLSLRQEDMMILFLITSLSYPLEKTKQKMLPDLDHGFSNILSNLKTKCQNRLPIFYSSIFVCTDESETKIKISKIQLHYPTNHSRILTHLSIKYALKH